MSAIRVVVAATSGFVTLMLAACGGGGNGSDISPSSPPISTASGADNFLLFPNPQVQPDGTFQTNTADYAQAYYAAIDPGNAKDTLVKWKAANGFDTGTGTTVAVFGDTRDLGYGRRMSARQNTDGTIAFLVENYLANPGGAYAYSSLSLDAAVHEDVRWRVLINAIEFSPGPGGTLSFAKFYNFNATTGQRELTVNLDGRGEKAMPGVCITCHGGRGDALMPPGADGKPVFNLVQNTASRARGDVQGHLAPFEVTGFDFSTLSGFTRSDQQAKLKVMNQLVLCSYPLPTSAPKGFAEDACRRDAIDSEWQAPAADLIKQAYGGDGLPGTTYADTLLPADWVSNQQVTLYQNVVVPSCRACHILRGTAAQSDIDLTTFDNFQRFAKFQGNGYPRVQGFDDRIKSHVIDRGNMPLAKIVYDTFWNSTNPATLAVFLQKQGFDVRDGAGAVLKPGRPVAVPGPDRVVGVMQGPISLSAEGSLFAQRYNWSIVSGPDGAVPPTGATLVNPTSARPMFNVTSIGTYVLQLVASSTTSQSAPALLTLVVNDTLFPAPEAIRFADIQDVLKSGTCNNCHNPAAVGATRPPIFFSDASGNNIDRNGDGRVDAIDDLWFYAEIRSRINFIDIAASPLLRKPAGAHHNGGQLIGFDATARPGDQGRGNYDLFLNWILNNAPR